MTRSFLLAAVAAASLVGLVRHDAGAQATPPPASIVIVHIKNFANVPASVTIKPGDSVEFINDDSTPHTATATDKSFDSGNLDQNAKWTHAFKSAGTYAYICTYHPYMKGTVIVKATE